jgi:perosamine synthetase
MKNINIPPRQALGKTEIKMIQNVIKHYSNKKQDPGYNGKYEAELCKLFSTMMHGGYTDAVSSGTAATYVAINSLKLKKNSEILISPVTDSGPLNSIILSNFKPKLIDSSKNTYNVSLEELKKRITNKTKAVILMHIAGQASQISKIKKYLNKKKIFLIEDCSQAPFAKCDFCESQCGDCKKKYVGEFGDISIFSTMFSKTISSCGSAGLVFTKNKKLYHNILAISDRGKPIWKKNINMRDPSLSLFPALNFNSNEFSCAVMIASLKRVHKTIKKRVNFLLQFEKLIKNTNCTIFTKKISNLSPFFCPIIVRSKKLNAKKYAKTLKQKGIPLLERYGCVISEWKFSKRYLQKNYKTKNAIEFRDKSFNLFLNERYSYKLALKFSKIIKTLDKKLNENSSSLFENKIE